MVQAAEQAASTQPFQPAIPVRSAKLAGSQEGRKTETPTDKLVRLAYGDAQHRDEVSMLIELFAPNSIAARFVGLTRLRCRAQVAALAAAEFYGQYSFEPELGPRPLGKHGREPQPTPLDELVSGARIEAARARAAEEV